MWFIANVKVECITIIGPRMGGNKLKYIFVMVLPYRGSVITVLKVDCDILKIYIVMPRGIELVKIKGSDDN